MQINLFAVELVVKKYPLHTFPTNKIACRETQLQNVDSKNTPIEFYKNG